MTKPCSRAEYILNTTLILWDNLVFGRAANVGNLVFVYFNDEKRWAPCWVIDTKDGKYEVETAWGNERKSGLDSSQIGFAIDSHGKHIKEALT